MLTDQDIIMLYDAIFHRVPNSDEIAVWLSEYKDFRELFIFLNNSYEASLNKPDFSKSKFCIVIAEQHGVKFYVNMYDVGIGIPAIRGEFELAEIVFCLNHITSGSTVVDIGANIGIFTMLFAKATGPDCMVYAFEPIEENYSLLEKSLEINNFKNVKLVTAAVGKEAGVINFHVPDFPNSGDGHFLSSVEPTSRQVKVITLDEYFNDRDVDFIKMDIEGAEHLAMLGAKETLKKRPVILSEISDKFLTDVSGTSGNLYIDYMAKNGYDCYRLTEDGRRGKQILEYTSPLTENVVFWPKERE